MPKSLLQRAVQSVFPIPVGTYWFATYELMKNQIGPVAIQTSLHAGKVKAFFIPHVLVGQDNAMHIHHIGKGSFHTTFQLAMKEPVGKGSSTSEAVLDLWEQITDLPNGCCILKFQQHLDHANLAHAAKIEQLSAHECGLVSDPQYAEYTMFQFDAGLFIDRGIVAKAAPPARTTNLTDLQPTSPIVLRNNILG